MHFHLLSLFPEMFDALDYGVIGRAHHAQHIRLTHWNPRDYTDDPHHTVDDRPYGGGPGMVMKIEPLERALTDAKAKAPDARTIYLSPQGQPLTQPVINQLAKTPELILLCGRYEGIDERLITKHVDEEYSIGDFVVSGGELPAMLMIDAIARQIPGVLGEMQSAERDSFSDGLLNHPTFTRPECYEGQSVPNVLLSGDHGAIERWRLKQSLGKTWQKRPDLLKRRVLSEAEQALLDEFKKEHTHE